MPRLAPVTIATRPESPRSMGLCLVDRSHGANRINDRNQNLGPHPGEAALFARPSRRMAAGTVSPVAVLRDARKSALLRTRRFPQTTLRFKTRSLSRVAGYSPNTYSTVAGHGGARRHTTRVPAR